MLRILQAEEEYESNCRQYTAQDGASALLLFGVIVSGYALLALLQIKSAWIQGHVYLTGFLFNACITGIALWLVKAKRRTLDTIGLYRGKWKRSILIGTVLACILLFNNCLSHLIAGEQLLPAREIVPLLAYYLLVALCEEVVFRGYIGTRIYGLLEKRWLAVCVTGILFIVMHFPYRMIAYGMTISDLTIHSMGWLIDLFVTHVVLQFIYLKTNSLYGAIIPHWFSNFAYNIIAQ